MLQLGEDDVVAHEVHVLERDGVIIGWHRVTFHDDAAELEDLWLEPGLIGKGLGRALFDHAAEIARGHGAVALEWDAEPFARGFYEAMGGVEVGRTPSAAAPGRTLPRMRLELG
jgi:GNAT superfamily N-acetyltransferase